MWYILVKFNIHSLRSMNNMKNGLTLLEVIIGCVIVLLVGIGMFSMVANTVSSENPDTDFDYTYISPQLETAKQQRKMVEELKRQNDLMEERMRQFEQK